MSEQKETVLFENNGVTVTNARFIVPSQTYAMAGITSVRFFTEKPSVLWPLLCFLIGLFALGNSGNIWSVALPILAGVALLVLRKPRHHVVLSVASGESRALNSKDKMFIAAVINALNDAIVSRG